MKHLVPLLFFLFFACNSLFAQTELNPRIQKIEQDLKELSFQDQDLISEVNLSTKSISIQDYVRLLAKTADINISIDPALQYQVAAHFTDEEPINIILHLCKRFDLDANITGSIIYLSQAEPEEELPKVKEFTINYNAYSDVLSFDLKNDTLELVVKEIVDQSKRNLVLQQGVGSQLISGYVKDMPFEEAIGNLSYSNGLVSEKMNDGTFVLMLPSQEQLLPSTNGKANPNKPLPPYRPKSLGVTFNYQLAANEQGEKRITVEATKTPILDLIKPIADEHNIDYVFLAELEGEATIKADNITLNDYFTRVLDATDYSYAIKNGMYVFSKKDSFSVNEIVLYQFQERAVDPLLGVLSNSPMQINSGGSNGQFITNNSNNSSNANRQSNQSNQLFGNRGNQRSNNNQSTISYFNDTPVSNVQIGNVSITSIPEYNSVLLLGSKSEVQDIRFLLEQLDKRVPLVLLELIVVDVKRGNSVGAGLNSVGVGTQPTQTQGDLFNGGFRLSAGTINSILQALEGVGSINLGRVGANFFAGLVALENNHKIEIRNTTKLSALNSHIAEFTFGATDYYVNEQVTSIPSINGVQVIENRQYLPIDASTSLKIRPVVSGDNYVTLTVEFSESQFNINARRDLQSPPPTDQRSFTSIIRVKDQEMIVLGGIEREEKSNTGEGVPFLARVPVIKWFFGNRKKTKSKQRQIVFIRPSIVY